MKLTIIFLLLVVTCFMTCFAKKDTKKDMDTEFQKFRKQHGKKYKNKHAEENAIKNFKDNCEKSEKHNEKRRGKGKGHKSTCNNKFSDRVHTEVIEQRCKTRAPPTARALPAKVARPTTFPSATVSEIDYSPYCHPAKDQGDCGSCWAFATIAQVECKLNLVNKKLPPLLSPQRLVDCSTTGNNGCDGGWPPYAMKYILANGTSTLEDYNYTGVAGTCQDSMPSQSYNLNALNDYYIKKNPNIMRDFIAFHGPIVVVVHATAALVSYDSGIFDDDACDVKTDCSKDVNHAVLAVGFGSENGTDYYIIRNSWGPDWGMDGNFRIATDSACLADCWGMGLFQSP